MMTTAVSKLYLSKHLPVDVCTTSDNFLACFTRPDASAFALHCLLQSNPSLYINLPQINHI